MLGPRLSSYMVIYVSLRQHREFRWPAPKDWIGFCKTTKALAFVPCGSVHQRTLVSAKCSRMALLVESASNTGLLLRNLILSYYSKDTRLFTVYPCHGVPMCMGLESTRIMYVCSVLRELQNIAQMSVLQTLHCWWCVYI